MADPKINPYSPKLRKVAVDQLRPGMYIHDLQTRWFDHPFWRTRFLIENDRTIERLREGAITEVIIDTQCGLDLDDITPPPPGADDRQRFAAQDQRFREAAEQRVARARNSVSIEEERWRVQFLKRDALLTVHDLMEDIRLGHSMDIRRAEPVIDKMIASVLRHPDALIPLLHVKDYENYSYQHALSVAATAIAFGATLGLDEETLRQTAMGALLQDIGKARIPEDILQKPDRLTAFEMRWIRRHVDESQAILEDSPGITDLMLEIVTNHHERIDGTGYPHAVAGDSIPLHAQMTSIVDVYDALTSDRPFQQRTEPTYALRQLYGMADSHFHEDLLQAFVRTVGIYPVGSLVRLENGCLAVVLEENRDNLLKPRVQVMYDSRERRYLRPYVLDLGRRLDPPAIVGVESFAYWGIDPRRWQPR